MLVIMLVAACSGAFALEVDALNPSREYKVDRIVLVGNQRLSDGDLLQVMSTKSRPFYQFWEKRPPFESDTFVQDLKRIKSLYRTYGYYRMQLSYDLDVSGDLVTPRIRISEGPPVKVATRTIEVLQGAPRPKQLEPHFKLPLRAGDDFKEDTYQLSQQALQDLYLRHGYARITAQRHAEVFVGPGTARVQYKVEPGKLSVFGPTSVSGLDKVSKEIVMRELTYRAGKVFDPRKIETSRENLLNLNLFAAVQFMPEQDPKDPRIVPITIDLREKPSRKIDLTLGYNTQTLFNVGLGWRDYNWLGGGRQLSIDATYSNVTSSLRSEFVQPHFLTSKMRAVIDVRQDQEIYQTYTLYASRFEPRLSYGFNRNLTGYFGYRLDYLKFNSVNPSTIAAVGGFRSNGVLSGPAAGLIFNTVTEPLNPQQGWIITLNMNQAGAIFGGNYSYYRLAAEARKYIPLGWKTVLATRFKLGLADTLGAPEDIPLSERFYSGGEGSVRGYGLRRIGPLSASNDPLGGLSLAEGSLELRRPLFWKLSGALFFDFGQVSTQSFDPPLDHLVYGFGPALNFTTPVGPLSIYLGIPSKAPRGDRSWQVYFSVGQFF